jgi:Mn-dependent DtxR family transcriptional regulator
MGRTSRAEDYLEAIYGLAQDWGHATTFEIADRLRVSAPSVSSMVKRLAVAGYLEYEPNRGMTLTEEGERVARSVISRHRMLVEFLTVIGVDRTIANDDAGGIRHHLHPKTTSALEKLTAILCGHPVLLERLRTIA